MNPRFKWMGLLVLTGALLAHAEDPPDMRLLGAEALIGKIQAEMADSTSTPASAVDPASAAYRTERDAFLQTAPTLPASQAAEAWLNLAGKFWDLNAPPSGFDDPAYFSSATGDPLSFCGLIAAIPPPDAWPIIQETLDQNPAGAAPQAQARTAVLRAAFAFLNRDSTRLKAALKSLGAKTAGLESYRRDQYRELIRELEEWPALFEGRSAGLVDRFARDLKRLKPNSRFSGDIEMPDVVSLAGTDKAAALIRQALAVPGLRLDAPGGSTLRLAQETALAQMEALPSPQWGLVDAESNGIALFEAMSLKFPRSRDDEHAATEETPTGESPDPIWDDYGFENAYRKASASYLSGLLRENRTEDALRHALTLDEEDVEAYSFASALNDPEQVPAPVRLAFLGQWLAAKPELPLWDTYVQLSVAAGQIDAAIQLLDELAARTDLGVLPRFEVVRGKGKLLLALDQADNAVALWRTLADLAATNEMPSVQIQLESRKLKLGQLWARIGLVLKRNDWFDEGKTMDNRARRRLAELKPDERMDGCDGGFDFFLDDLLELDRFAEAEQLVWTRLFRLLEETKQRPAIQMELQPVDLTDSLGKLIHVYHRAGRHADILVLLEDAPWWGTATNLADLRDEVFFIPAAQALHVAGRDDEAWAILTRYLAEEPGDDKAYAVLAQIPHPDRLPFLDRLYARDRFEERPLIWKAALLLKDGQLDAAETVVRQALKVDPTDGEQPNGDRVRAYAVLADVLTAKNQPADAEFFAKVVRSVRIAEEGDQLNEAGLTSRSLQRYAEAETYFADAYCVQWRLAERFQALGQAAEAQKHYQIAFERMPEQFGQVASLCFGCMGVFDHAESRGAAETVLTRLAANPPVRPAVFYLLGQLREEQQRYPEAYAEYRKALDLDPDYLDVWEKINGLRDHLDLPAGEWNAIQLRMLRMDPFSRHISIQSDNLDDLKGFWMFQTDALKLNLPVAESLLPLSASLRAKPQRKDSPMDSFSRRLSYRYYQRSKRIEPPGEVVAKLPFLSKLDQVQNLLGLSRNASANDGFSGFHLFP